MELSMIIPCRNEWHYIQGCLDALFQQQLETGTYEIIVADGMSDDGTRELLSQIASKNSCLVVIDNLGRIVSTGLNAAIRQARGDYIIRIDAHTVYSTDYAVKCLTAIKSGQYANVGGPWVARGADYISSAISASFQSRFSAGGAASHSLGYRGEVDTVYLGCWHKSVFQKVGYFDEELVRNQDDEFNLRITRSGGKIYQDPDIKSWYTPRGSLSKLFKQYYQYGYWKVRVIQKHKIPASIRHLVPVTFILSLALLSVLSLFIALLRWLLLLEAGLYLFLILFASLHTAFKTGLQYLPILPLVFACYHWGYGLGFTQGLIHFCITKKGASNKHTMLTR